MQIDVIFYAFARIWNISPYDRVLLLAGQILLDLAQVSLRYLKFAAAKYSRQQDTDYTRRKNAKSRAPLGQSVSSLVPLPEVSVGQNGYVVLRGRILLQPLTGFQYCLHSHSPDSAACLSEETPARTPQAIFDPSVKNTVV